MDSDNRSDPGELLEYSSELENEKRKGKLKIFLGYSAGVGKTYSMLKDAIKNQADGIDVQIGIIETHNRKETEELAKKLPQISRKTFIHKNMKVTDLDIDTCLEKRPGILLIDELAHSNPDGARNEKRYQDIEELLQAGINVYTTLNIQHLDSMNDLIAEITGIHVHETVPDKFFEQAHEIELIDLPPEDLLQRLREGKVYVPEQIKEALNNFFTDKNLVSLREMTLRKAANHIDLKLHKKIKAKDIELPRTSTDRILTILDRNLELNEKIIRISKRISDQTKSDWFVVYIETIESKWKVKSTPKEILTSINLAESLGANTSILKGKDYIPLLMDFAKKNNISRFIVGTFPKTRWKKLFLNDELDQIIRASGWIDVHVVTDSSITEKRAMDPLKIFKTKSSSYLISFLISVLTTGLDWLLKGYLDPINLIMIYLIAVVITAIFFGPGPSILNAVMNFIVFDFFFILPYFTLEIQNSQYIITLSAFLVIAIVVSYLISREKNVVLLYKEQGIELSQMYNLSLELINVTDLIIGSKIITNFIKDTFNLDVVLLIAKENNLEVIKSTFLHDLDNNSSAIAKYTFLSGKPSGLKTNSLNGTKMQFIPLTTPKKIVGVVGVQPIIDTTFLPFEQNELLKAVIDLAALTIERILSSKVFHK